MKVKVTFELDLKDTHYNIKKVKLIPVCLMNLGMWLDKLHCHYLEKELDTLVRTTKADCTYNDAMKKAIMENTKVDTALSKQLFNNYKVEGVTEDVLREAEGEIIVTEPAKKAIGKKTVELYKGLIKSKLEQHK